MVVVMAPALNLPIEIWYEIVKVVLRYRPFRCYPDSPRFEPLWSLSWTCSALRELALPYLYQHVTLLGRPKHSMGWLANVAVPVLSHPSVARHIKSLHVTPEVMMTMKQREIVDESRRNWETFPASLGDWRGDWPAPFSRSLRALLEAAKNSVQSICICSKLENGHGEGWFNEFYDEVESMFLRLVLSVIAEVGLPKLNELHVEYARPDNAISALTSAPSLGNLKTLGVRMANVYHEGTHSHFNQTALLELASKYTLGTFSLELMSGEPVSFTSFRPPAALRYLQLSRITVEAGLAASLASMTSLKTLVMTTVRLREDGETWEEILDAAFGLQNLREVALRGLLYRPCSAGRWFFSGTICTRRDGDLRALERFVDGIARRNLEGTKPKPIAERENSGGSVRNAPYDVTELIVCPHHSPEDRLLRKRRGPK